MAESPKLLDSLEALSQVLDQPSVPVAAPAPTVRIVNLPDRVPRRRKVAQPWWADVTRNAAPESPPLEAIAPSAPPRRRRQTTIDWKLVIGVGTASCVVLGVMVFAAWVTTPRAAKAVASLPPPPVVAAPILDPLVAAEPKITEPTADERLADLEKRYQEAVARLQAQRDDAEKPVKNDEPAAPRDVVAQRDVVEKPAKVNYGTAVDFVGSPSEANEQAIKHKKLVLILTISGNFEESCFT